MVTSMKDPSARAATIGLVLVAPAVFFIAAAVLNELGIGFFFEPVEALSKDPAAWRVFNVVSPILFMGGSLLALLLNVPHVVRLAAHSEPVGVTATVTVLRKPWNLAVAGAVLLVLFVLTSYLVLENWRCWVGLIERC